MKVVMLYRPNSEHSRTAEDFIREFSRRYGESGLEILDVDSRDGIAMASLYDIMEYPAILVLQDDGGVQRSWVGQLPLMDEVFAYAHA